MRFKCLRFLLLFILTLCAGETFAQSQAAAQQTATPAAERPTLQGLVIDNSGSLRADLDSVIGAAQTLVAGTDQSVETFIIRFVGSENIQLIRDFTRNKTALNRSLDDMYIEGGATAITDALYVAAEHISEREAADGAETRRALILISDGDDRGSRYKPEKLFALLREKKIQVHILGFPNVIRKERGKKDYEKAVAFINKLAQETGGRAFFADKASDLTASANELLKVLNGQ